MDVAKSRAAYIEQRQQTQDERKARAAEKLKNHQYKCLVKQDDAEIWRCKAEGTTAYAFDIMMTRYERGWWVPELFMNYHNLPKNILWAKTGEWHFVTETASADRAHL